MIVNELDQDPIKKNDLSQWIGSNKQDLSQWVRSSQTNDWIKFNNCTIENV